jgi:hypothetical protein
MGVSAVCICDYQLYVSLSISCVRLLVIAVVTVSAVCICEYQLCASVTISCMYL